MHSNVALFLIGVGIGLAVAIIGGLVEYWTTLRPGAESVQHRSSCLPFVIGGLALAVIAAMIASALLNGGIGEALIMGAGVLTGFYTGFIVSFGLWFLLDRK